MKVRASLLAMALAIGMAACAQPTPTPQLSPAASVSAAPSSTPRTAPAATPAPTATPDPIPTPLPDDVAAVALAVPARGIDVEVRASDGADADDFPPDCCAFTLSTGSQPGHNTNAFIFAHALDHLFKPLWSAQLGDEVIVTMSNAVELRYTITEIHPNVPCGDPEAEPNPDPVPALAIAEPGCEEGVFWLQPSEAERLTLQTSQGFNRNYGELVVVAEPAVAP